jgi:hypothetical protein
VHPYHLLRHDRVIFSHPAIEKLQASLANSVSKKLRKSGEDQAKKPVKERRRRARTEKAAEVA